MNENLLIVCTLLLIDPARPVIITPEKTTTIEAKDRSPITLTIGDNVTALTNTSINIQCPTSGVPAPTVTWTKDTQEILSGGRFIVRDDGSLLISEAGEEDSARYTCTTDSIAGKDSASSTVKIAGEIFLPLFPDISLNFYHFPLKLDHFAAKMILVCTV